MILVLPSDDDFSRMRMARRMTRHDAAVYPRTDGVGVRVEALAVGPARRTVLLGHARRERVVGYADAIPAVMVAVATCVVGHWQAGGVGKEPVGLGESEE